MVLKNLKTIDECVGCEVCHRCSGESRCKPVDVIVNARCVCDCCGQEFYKYDFVYEIQGMQLCEECFLSTADRIVVADKVIEEALDG